MRYMLDTNICIYIIKNQPPCVAQRFAEYHYGDVMMSAVTFAELWHGVVASGERMAQNRQALLALSEDIPVLPFGESQAEQFGVYRGLTTSRKAVLDCMIAAHAYTESCVLVTNNERDFQHFSDLSTENWVSSPQD